MLVFRFIHQLARAKRIQQKLAEATVKAVVGNFNINTSAQVLLSSVGHGCAMDIAGKNQADPQGLLRTLELITPHLTKTPNDIAK